jgi:hypothetical protein
VRWLDPDGLEVKANQLAQFDLRAEIRIVSEIGGILRVPATVNAALGDLDDALVVDVAATLRCQVRNDPIERGPREWEHRRCRKAELHNITGQPGTPPKSSKAL